MITVVSVTGVSPEAHQKAIELSQKNTPVPSRPLLIYREGMDLPEYSRFILHELHKHITTPLAMIVQADGYAINPERWTNDFLDWSYIGAPWPYDPENPGNCVGNGGFSLRSRRFLEACASVEYNGGNEDEIVCRTPLPGMRYAPPALAQAFSHELVGDLKDSFGFHGRYDCHSHLILG